MMTISAAEVAQVSSVCLPQVDLATAEVIPVEGRRGPGRPSEWNWKGALVYLVTVANTPDGLPDKQADAERLVLKWFEDNYCDSPAPSAIREHVSPIYRLCGRRSKMA